MWVDQLPSPEDLTDIFLLESVKGFGPQKFKELFQAGIPVSDALRHPEIMLRFGKRGEDFRKQIELVGITNGQDAASRAMKQLASARSVNASILTYDHPLYPPVLFASNLPVPVLFARGDASVFSNVEAVACVGSRNIRPPYSSSHDKFASHAANLGFTIVSGFATGADIIGHLAAERAHGKTVCVMPSGLDRPFPPEHKQVWQRFLNTPGAAFVSEFGFGVGANALNLRKRNKMIIGMARGVLVSQSSEDGGAMNAYRFAIEQKKPIATFRPDGSSDTSGNDLIAGSAQKVRSTVLEPNQDEGWIAWLRTL